MVVRVGFQLHFATDAVGVTPEVEALLGHLGPVRAEAERGCEPFKFLGHEVLDLRKPKLVHAPEGNV